jgi:hypothetical protein
MEDGRLDKMKVSLQAYSELQRNAIAPEIIAAADRMISATQKINPPAVGFIPVHIVFSHD